MVTKLFRDYLKSFSTVAPKPKPVRVSSGPKVKHHLEYVKEGLLQNGHEDTPLIDDNFTEVCISNLNMCILVMLT